MSTSAFDSLISNTIDNAIPTATATGSVNVITATYFSILTLTDKVLCAFVATGANTTTTPTFSPNGLTAHTITKLGGVSLAIGDIASIDSVCFLEYNLANTRWELINPATNVSPWVIASGSINAITATYLPVIPTLYDGLVLSFRATGANTTTTPTFSPNGLTAHTITKLGGVSLAVGDIAGNLAEYTVRYNLANTRWELLNPTNAGNIVVRSQVFTSSGTYTPHPNMLYCKAIVTGGGAAGGSAWTTDAYNFITRGGGGGAGGTAIGIISKATIGTSQVVTVASWANPDLNYPTPLQGATGGNSSLGSLLIGYGGIGGNPSTTESPPFMGLGGLAGGSAAQIIIHGGDGGNNLQNGNNAPGGGSYWGGGGISLNQDSSTGGYNIANLVFGEGGGGGLHYSGLYGAPGVVVITEYCSA